MVHSATLSESAVHHLLSNARRRETLAVLLSEREAVTVRELSETIAASEAGVTPAPRPLRESVYNTLHQTHLPKLAEFGLVEYEADRKVVRPRRKARRLDRYMDTMTPLGLTWGEYYRALGIGGLVAVVASLAGVPLFSATDPLVFASVVLAVFAASTLYQLWRDLRLVFKRVARRAGRGWAR